LQRAAEKTRTGGFKAVVFDFDGTLAELNIDFSAMRAAVLALVARYRIPAEGIGTLHILEMIEAAADRLALRSPEEASPFFQTARELIVGIEIDAAGKGTLFAGTRELLAELGRRSIRVGVVTRNCRAAVFTTFPDIDRYCQAVLTRDDTERIKPDPKHLTTALSFLGALPGDAAMVGDHPLDIQLGKAAGTFTIGVLSGHSTREALCGAGADLILPDASALLDNIP
jgi:phosphoglycolate phosphatase